MSAHATAEDLSLLIDRRLPRDREQSIEQHLRDCDACREHYQSTRRMVERLRSLERVAPPSTLGMVVQRHRMELGNSKLRRRLERDWKRWPDPMILVYLAVVVALGAMTVIVSRAVDREDSRGTVIYTPVEIESETPLALTDEWVEPGISDVEAAEAAVATPEQAREVIERVGAGLPEGVRTVVARAGDQVVTVRLRQASTSPE